MLGLTEFLVIAIAGVFLAMRYMKPKKNLPPKPSGLPIVGNLFQLGNYPHKKFFEWAEQYGKLYTIDLINQRSVVVNDYKVAKEMLFSSNFVARPSTKALELFTGGQYGIIYTNGKQWEEQRRWTLRMLRDFGFGKTSAEGIIMDEVNEVINDFKKNEGNPIKISERFNPATFSALWTLLTGNRLKHDDPKLTSMVIAFKNIIPVISRSGLTFGYWVRHLRPAVYQEVLAAANKILGFAKEVTTEHWDTYKDGISRDFIDEYISEVKNTKDPSSSFYKENGRKNLHGVLVDLVEGGSETTSNTLAWAISYLSHFQQVQKKLQEELDSVLEQRPVSLSDKANLPYTEAVILETLRHSALVSVGVQHEATVDTVVEGYDIPKGTAVFTNIYYIHHDSKIWGDPQNFRPERFLSADGKKVVKNENLIPFQLGRRQCLGESMARDSLLLFLSTIFQKFHITKVEKELPEPEASFILAPQPCNFVFKSRE